MSEVIIQNSTEAVKIMNMDLLEIWRTLNISPFSAISAILLLLLGIFYFGLQKTPSGPWGLPFLGLWPFLKDKTVHKQLKKYMEKYGDVYSYTYVGKLYIHLGSAKAVKEAFVTKADCFTDRFSGFNLLTSLFKKGLVVENGEAWRVLRKFYIGAFREHGVSSVKDYMSGPILDSVNSTVDDLREKNGATFDIVQVLTVRSSEIMRRVLFNDEGMSVEELKEFIEEYEKVVPVFVNTSSLLNGDFSRYFIFPFMKSYKVASEGIKKAASILEKIIKRHEASFNKDSIRNIIDSFIKERNDRRSKGDPTAKYFTDITHVSTLLQFVGDGVTAVAIFIAFMINDLLEHPEEQEKIYKELEEVIGPDRQPTLQDKTKLPYLNAFIQESQRTMDFINIFVSVECTKATTLNGQNIPKGALLVTNVYACHMDPKVYDEPNEFKPARYVAEPGRQKAETPMTFGIGRRSCMGEPFTMMQVFLFLAAVIKNFRLARPEGVAKKPFPDIVLDVCAHPRK